MTNASAYLAAFAVGLFYACAGANKLWHPIRRAQMKMTMLRLFGRTRGGAMYAFVSWSELAFGAGAMAATVLPWHMGLASLAGLLVISLVAFRLDGHARMCERWSPFNLCDWASCCLYTPEVLLATLCVVAITGAVS